MDWDRLYNAVARSEGFSAYPYKDSEGYWTIGHGILIDKRKGAGLSREESKVIMRMRLQDVNEKCNGTWRWFKHISPLRQEALVRMGYNLGFSGLREFKKMIRAFGNFDYALAADEALDSLWALQVGNRANRIANNIRRG